MNAHASAELLSAYLDRELARQETEQLEEHLETCSECHVRLEGLQRVVTNLKSLHHVAPPSTMEQAVARRIALADERVGILDRIEEGMSLLTRQSPILSMFGVVIALVLFIYFFSYTLHLRENAAVPVIFQDLPSSTSIDPAAGSQLEVAGRQLAWSDGVWVEEGVSGAPSRTVVLTSEEGQAFLAAHPELADFASLDRTVILMIEGEIVRLEAQ